MAGLGSSSRVKEFAERNFARAVADVLLAAWYIKYITIMKIKSKRNYCVQKKKKSYFVIIKLRTISVSFELRQYLSIL